MGSRVWWAAGGVAAGVGLVGLGLFFNRVGLDHADQWASVIGVFIGLISVVLLVVDFVAARRRAPGASGGQFAEEVTQNNYQFGAVSGGLRIGIWRRDPASPRSPAGLSSQPPTGGHGPDGGQTVGRVGGDNVQAGSVDGGVEIEQTDLES